MTDIKNLDIDDSARISKAAHAAIKKEAEND